MNLDMKLITLNAVCEEIIGVAREALNDLGDIERMKNCINCGHYEVCVVVHDRKRRKAGDYTACGKWTLADA